MDARLLIGPAAALAVLVMGVGGCAEERDESTVVDVVGTVASIDLPRRTVMVTAYIEKHEREETFAVEVTNETEILVNGALAKLEDIRIGERAVGSVRIVKQDDRKRFEALQVRVQRAEVLTAPDAPPEKESDG